MKGLELASACTTILRDGLGENLVMLDMRQVSTVADYFVIATGNSEPHLAALSARIDRELKDRGIPAFRKAGTPATGWMVVDCFDVVIHVMSAEMRAFYDLEALWSDASEVPVPPGTPVAGGTSRD